MITLTTNDTHCENSNLDGGRKGRHQVTGSKEQTGKDDGGPAAEAVAH